MKLSCFVKKCEDRLLVLTHRIISMNSGNDCEQSLYAFLHMKYVYSKFLMFGKLGIRGKLT